MMRRPLNLALASAALALAAAGAASAAPTVYTNEAAFDLAVTTTLLQDFEDVAPTAVNTPIPGGFVDNGVTFTGLAGVTGFPPVPNPNVYVAGPPILWTNFGADIPLIAGSQLTSFVLTANGEEDIRVTFGQGYGAVGVDLYFNGLGLATLNFLDQGGGVIAGFASADGRNPLTGLRDIGFGGIVSDTPVWGFRFTTTGGGQTNTGIDNIRVAAVQSPAIPEPGAWALMIAGFGLAGATLRRRRAAVA